MKFYVQFGNCLTCGIHKDSIQRVKIAGDATFAWSTRFSEMSFWKCFSTQHNPGPTGSKPSCDSQHKHLGKCPTCFLVTASSNIEVDSRPALHSRAATSSPLFFEIVVFSRVGCARGSFGGRLLLVNDIQTMSTQTSQGWDPQRLHFHGYLSISTHF